MVVNLYPFEQTVAKPGCTLDDAIENIDIGGPAMLRSAAKNFARVAVVDRSGAVRRACSTSCDANGGALSATTRFALSVAAFNRVAQYDGAISNYLSALGADGTRSAVPGAAATAASSSCMDLRYGENPHQHGRVLPRPVSGAGHAGRRSRQLQGKELSYNNIADADAAWECVQASSTRRPA